MLVLHRRAGETIVIGNDITVTLLGFKGRTARIGIVAPQEVKVHRLEVHERIHRTRPPRANRARIDAA